MYNPEEVKRCFALEKHTVSSLVSLIEHNGWTEYVDLVEGGHNVLLFSDDEERTAKEDWEMAVEAGMVTKDQITWSTKEETEKVCIVVYWCDADMRLGVWRVLSYVAECGTQPLATQTRHQNV